MSEEGWRKRFRSELDRCRVLKRGCAHCKSGECFRAFETREDELLQWQRQFKALSKNEQDTHLLWMFTSHPLDEVDLPERLPTTPVTESESDKAGKSQVATSPATHSAPDSEPGPKRRHVVTSSESGDPGHHVPTSCSSSSSVRSSGSGKAAQSSGHNPTRPHRQYNAGKRRRATRSIGILGQHVCRKAGKALLAVGTDRLHRIRDHRPDGRRDRPSEPGKMSASVWKFLWSLYHQVGEAMPDKFDFSRLDCKSKILAASPDTTTTQVSVRVSDLDAEERAIAAQAIYIESARAPQEAASIGPGMLRGPLRFLPPGKRLHYYFEYAWWSKHSGEAVASFNTFLRAFKHCETQKILRIRNVGNHPTCDQCVGYKKQLRLARWPRERHKILEQYSKHIRCQWLDRQAYENACNISLNLRAALREGNRMERMAWSASQICLAVDGMDQAKFRVPRIFCKTHELEKVVRPALHVQGAWAHGFGYHLAVMDADMRKDTNNNVEVISGMLEQIQVTHGALPLGLHLQQDNTCRECKNQKVIKWACKLVALGVFQWITFGYLIVGHTHENLDGTFGQIAVRLSRREFDDDADVVSILSKLLAGLGIDPASQHASRAYKCDVSADWETWWDEIPVRLTHMTGPGSPHQFRICLRKDLGNSEVGSAETDVPAQPFPGSPPPQANDVMLVSKAYMHDEKVHEVKTILPAQGRPRLTRQPGGQHGRRNVSMNDRLRTAQLAEAARSKGVISDKAADYLSHWSLGTRHRQPRPQVYAFLRKSQQAHGRAVPVTVPPPGIRRETLVMHVAAIGDRKPARQDLQSDNEDNDEAEPGDLAIQ